MKDKFTWSDDNDELARLTGPIIIDLVPRIYDTGSAVMIMAKNGDLNDELDDLNLSARARNALRYDGLTTIEAIDSLTDQELLRVPTFGRKSLREVREVLASWKHRAAARCWWPERATP